jgi:uncharacterized protein YndB with AHSA1/START domain
MMLKLRLIVGVVLVAAALLIFGAVFAIARLATGLAGFRAVLLGELAALAVLLCVLGSIFVRTRTVEERAVRFRAPRERVYARTTDPDISPRVNEGIRSIEWLAGRPGEAGARYRARLASGPAMIVEVLAAEPPTRFVTRSRIGRSSFVTERTYEVVPGGTTVRINQVRRLSLPARALAALMRGRLAAKTAELEARLVAEIEREDETSPSSRSEVPF